MAARLLHIQIKILLLAFGAGFLLVILRQIPFNSILPRYVAATLTWWGT